MSGLCAATTPATGARSAFGGNSAKCTTFELRVLGPRAEALGGVVGERLVGADDRRRGRPGIRGVHDRLDRAGRRGVDGGDDAEGELGLLLPDVGGLRRAGDARHPVLGADRVHRELHAAGVRAEDGVHTFLGDQPRCRVGAGGGIALAVLHDQVDLVLLVADGQPARLVHRVGPQLVPALGDLAAGRGFAGQLEHGADLELVGRSPPPPVSPPHAASRLGPATTPPTTRPARVRKRRRLM